MNKYIKLVNTEFKRIGKDNLLLILALYPFILGILGKYFVPFIRNKTLSSSFDLANHYMTIIVFFILVNPYIYGAISAFTVIDEREEKILQAIRVTPLKIYKYLSAKIITISIVSILTGIFLIYFLDLIEMKFYQSLVINVLLSLSAPFNMLLINLIAKNKVEGFAAVKGTGLLLLLPVVALYIPKKFNLIFGIIPGYWPAMAINIISNPSFTSTSYWMYILVGYVYMILLIYILYKKLMKKLAF